VGYFGFSSQPLPAMNADSIRVIFMFPELLGAVGYAFEIVG
jgi:hypothetical protein